jgi:hypothetical protein
MPSPRSLSWRSALPNWLAAKITTTAHALLAYGVL